MAEETFIVAYDIQQAGASNAYFAKTEIPTIGPGGTAYTEAKVGNAEFEGNGTTEPGLYAQTGANVAQCKLLELKAKSAADAVAICREKFAQNAGGERTAIKPNGTNFKVVA